MAGENNRRQDEQEAVRTTIVGGRPPGCGKSTGNVPRGIEVLTKKAAVDADFRAALLANRGEAARSIGLQLSPAESMMLSAVPAAQLRSIIESTVVPPSHVPAFLGKVAAVMLAALGVIQAGCDDSRRGSPAGIAPDDPSSRNQNPAATQAAQPASDQPITVAGAVIVKPLSQPVTQATQPAPAVAGVRPAESERIAGERIDRPATQPPQNITMFGLMIDRPQDTVIRGLRADPPQTAPATQPATEPEPPRVTVLGIIPDRPMVVKGIRVDRPETPTTAPATQPTTQPGAQAAPEPDFPVAIDGIRPDRPRRNE